VSNATNTDPDAVGIASPDAATDTDTTTDTATNTDTNTDIRFTDDTRWQIQGSVWQVARVQQQRQAVALVQVL
jgi:hypothetical protein